MSAKGLRPAGLAIGAVVILAVIGVASAWAAAVKSSVAVPGQTVASTSTKCPKGKALVSQGFGTKNFTTDGTGSTVVRVDSHRSGTGLETRATNFNDADGVLDAYAYCSKMGRDVRVVRGSVLIPARGAGTAKARCPRGSSPIAGGFGSPGFSPSGAQAIALTSRLDGRAWRVKGINQPSKSGQKPGKLVAYAYCLDDAPKIVVRHATHKVARGDLETIVATCPRGAKAISGGFDGRVSLGARPKAAGAIISRRAKHGRAWKIGAVSATGTTSQATVYAYCLKR